MITRWGATTNPLPSSAREHERARPRTFSTLALACRTTGLLSSTGSAGPTSVIGVGENGASTSGNPETSNSLVSSDGRSRSTLGMIVSTIRSTDESRTAPVRPV